jgi:curved DNA-binding protein CbpA
MRTLYDLLGARPDDDAEGLRNAFRKAAKANHPDLHAGDPDASIRFRQIVEAYDILRDAEQRAEYDRLLKFERERFRRKLKHTVSYLVHNIVSDAIAVAGLAIVLGGGYTLFAYISKTPTEAAKLVEVTGRGPAKAAAVRPAARTDTTAPSELRDSRMAAPEKPIASAAASAANDGGAPGAEKGRRTPSSVGLGTEIAKPGPLDQDKAETVEVRLSSPEKDNGIQKLFSSHFAMSDDKLDPKIPDAPNANAGTAKPPEIKIPARPRTAAKRQATNRATFAQASLENRSTSACSGSCSGDAPPLFGVGF